MTANNKDSQALQYARKALTLMNENSVDPTPTNYSVWYRYIAGDVKELNKEIDGILSKKFVVITDDVNTYLYNKFILASSREEEKAIGATSQNTQNVLSEIMDVIHKFSGDTETYNTQVDKHVTKLSQKITDPTLAAMAKEIISQVAAIRESGVALNTKLEASKQEVVKLKTNLEKITHESTRDFLTGVANRRAFENKLEELTKWAKDENGDLCLLMIDIDHFKKFNDTFGHLIGDEVLKKVGRSLFDSIKGKDFVARYGGEEFAVLLPQTPLASGLIVAENIRKNIAETGLIRKDTGKSIGDVHVSIGVARYRQSDSVALFISRADEALYRSKTGGRNRVTPESFA